MGRMTLGGGWLHRMSQMNVMFQPNTTSFLSSTASFAGLSGSLSSTLAYAVELRNAKITVMIAVLSSSSKVKHR